MTHSIPHYMKRILTTSVAGLALFSAQHVLANEAIVYTSNNVQTIDAALDIAKESNPDLNIQKVTSGTGALMKRIEAEVENPLGDVVWGGGFGTMAAFKHNFESYDSPNKEHVDEAFRGEDDLWLGSNIHIMIVMVNERQLRGEEAPKTWEDLFDPKWKGKIIIGDPTSSGSAYDQIYGIHQLYGEEGLKTLAANVDVSKSSGQVYKGVANGEYPIGITMEYAAYAYIAGGQPGISIVYPEDGSFAAPEAVAVIKNPKNGQENARKLHDILMSKKVQEAELVENFRRPSRSDIDVAALTKLPNLSDIQVEPTGPMKAAEVYDDLIELWKQALADAN